MPEAYDGGKTTKSQRKETWVEDKHETEVWCSIQQPEKTEKVLGRRQRVPKVWLWSGFQLNYLFVFHDLKFQVTFRKYFSFIIIYFNQWGTFIQYWDP